MKRLFDNAVGFALVGYKFNLLDDKTPHWVGLERLNLVQIPS